MWSAALVTLVTASLVPRAAFLSALRSRSGAGSRTEGSGAGWGCRRYGVEYTLQCTLCSVPCNLYSVHGHLLAIMFELSKAGTA